MQYEKFYKLQIIKNEFEIYIFQIFFIYQKETDTEKNHMKINLSSKQNRYIKDRLGFILIFKLRYLITLISTTIYTCSGKCS